MTEFIEIFQRKLELNDFEYGFEVELYNFYAIEKNENKYWLLQKYFKYNKNQSNENYYILHFIKYLIEKDNFFNEDLVKGLEFSVINYFENNLGTFEYFEISLELFLLLNINKPESLKKIFNKYLEKFNKNIKILSLFLASFYKSGEYEYFLKCAELILKQEDRSFYEFEIRERFALLDQNEFEKLFLKIIKIFSSPGEKEKLKKNFGEYYGLIDFGYINDGKTITDEILKKISKITNLKTTNEIKKFLFGDLNYITQSFINIEKIYFDDKLFGIIEKNDKLLLFEFLKQTNLDFLMWHNASFIGKHLNKDNINKCLSLYKGKEDKFYYVYLFLKSKKKYNILKAIKEDKIFSHLIKIENQQRNNKEFRENEEKKRQKERKNGILSLTNNNDGYYPKVLQDYYNLIRNKDDFEKFTKREKEKLNKSIIEQCFACLKQLEIKNYSDDKIKNIVTFSENGEGSYSVSWYVHYLYRILQISIFLDFDISDYYKSFIITYPLLFGDNANDEVLAYLKGNIEGEDIDYILNVYSRDIYENATGLRYYNYSGLCKFYEKFNKKFSKEQKDKLKSIFKDFIESDKIKYKDSILETYAILCNKDDFKSIYHEPDINYFKSIISNEIPISDDKRNEFYKQLKINELLITQYKDKEALLWRVKQIENGKILFNDPYELKDGEIIGKVHAISAIESELGLRHDDYSNFAYILTLNNVDIKDEMLGLFEIGLKINEDIANGLENKDYQAYSNYIINVFIKYVSNGKFKGLYRRINNTIQKYPNNGINIKRLNKQIGVKISQINKDPCGKYKVRNEYLKKENANLTSKNNKLRSTIQELTKIIGISNPKYLLFVEGLTDKRIIETALEKLGYNDLGIVVRSGGGARALEELIKGFICDPEMVEGIKIITLFDSDREGKTAFGRIANNFLDEKVNSSYLKSSKYEVYSILLPIPDIYDVFYDEKDKESCFITIESLFDKEVFIDWVRITGNEEPKLLKYKNKSMYILDNNLQKRNFSKFVGGLEKSKFKYFTPLFKQIKEIINGSQ